MKTNLPVVGSSRKRRDGLLTNCNPILNLLRSPPLKPLLSPLFAASVQSVKKKNQMWVERKQKHFVQNKIFWCCGRFVFAMCTFSNVTNNRIRNFFETQLCDDRFDLNEKDDCESDSNINSYQRNENFCVVPKAKIKINTMACFSLRFIVFGSFNSA